MVLQIFTLLGALGMFLYGMNLMSNGLQKAAGDRLRKLLSTITANPFRGVLTGLGITSIIQSSSATTVMVVGFVNAGLLTLAQAISVIMGANIGTTVTAWLVSWLGFKADISILAVPLMALGFILSISKKEKRRNVGDFIIGFSLLFLGLSLMKNSVPDLQQTPEVLAFIQGWEGHGFGSVLLFLAFGTVLTLILQSSSATMALTLIMLNLGWISFEMAAAMVLGENIGTTITANLAAIIANTTAKRTAFAHTVFNVFGVIWILAIFPYFIQLIGWITSGLFGLPNPADANFIVEVVRDANGNIIQNDTQTAALYGLSMLHTLFNTFNTLILVWFIKYIEKFVTWVIKAPKDEAKEEFRLKFINVGHIVTAELATEQAVKEVIHFATISRQGLSYAKDAIIKADTEEFEELRGKLVKYEEISDRIEYEIAGFLNQVSQEEISEATANKVKAMYQMIGELESLGDSGEAISRILTRKNINGQKFTPEMLKNINSLVDQVDAAYEAMIVNLKAAETRTLTEISNAEMVEERINQMRNDLRDEEVERIKNKESNYQVSMYYLDIINTLEKMGDFIINISQDLYKFYNY